MTTLTNYTYGATRYPLSIDISSLERLASGRHIDFSEAGSLKRMIRDRKVYESDNIKSISTANHNMSTTDLKTVRELQKKSPQNSDMRSLLLPLWFYFGGSDVRNSRARGPCSFHSNGTSDSTHACDPTRPFVHVYGSIEKGAREHYRMPLNSEKPTQA